MEVLLLLLAIVYVAFTGAFMSDNYRKEETLTTNLGRSLIWPWTWFIISLVFGIRTIKGIAKGVWQQLNEDLRKLKQT